MAIQQHVSHKQGVLDAVPFMVVILIAAHVIALVYWIYRLATDKQSQRTKRH